MSPPRWALIAAFAAIYSRPDCRWRSAERSWSWRAWCWREIPGNSGVFAALTKLVGSTEAIAYVGAGASAPLYPLWGELIRLLADAAVTAGKATERERELWCRRAGSDPLGTAHRIRSRLGSGRYAELIHETSGSPARSAS